MLFRTHHWLRTQSGECGTKTIGNCKSIETGDPVAKKFNVYKVTSIASALRCNVSKVPLLVHTLVHTIIVLKSPSPSARFNVVGAGVPAPAPLFQPWSCKGAPGLTSCDLSTECNHGLVYLQSIAATCAAGTFAYFW